MKAPASDSSSSITIAEDQTLKSTTKATGLNCVTSDDDDDDVPAHKPEYAELFYLFLSIYVESKGKSQLT